MFGALQREGRSFESTSSHCAATLYKLLAHNCLWGRQQETTSLISSLGGVKANEPALGPRTIIINTNLSKFVVSPYIFENFIGDSWRLLIDHFAAAILTPTRELAMQIGKECKKFTKALNLNVVCVYGGTGISEQIAELKRGAEIIVCTPGRMIDMLAANNGQSLTS